MTKIVFITGTGTEVGKTAIAAATCAQLCELGRRVAYWKPVQSGPESDAARIVAATAGKVNILPTLHSYPEPLSPHTAALKAGLPAATIAELCAAWPEPQSFDIIVVEGAGGLLVPLNAELATWRDLLIALQAQGRSPELWLVAASGLGTINHTTLSLEALAYRGLNAGAVIFYGEENPPNRSTLQQLFPSIGFYTVPPVEKLLDPAVESEPWEHWDETQTWHPYTQHQTAPTPCSLSHAQGADFYTTRGQRLLDGIGSWWVNTIGHGRPELGIALAAQQSRLDHCSFGGNRHEPSARLAHEILERAGADFSRVFFSDNGSTAVEVALKLLMQRAAQRGDSERRLVLCLDHAYHGDTFGAMAAGKGSGFFQPFQPYLFATHSIAPVCAHPTAAAGFGATARADSLAAFRELLQTRGGEILGMIIEPLVQGAGGMLMHDPLWLRELGGLLNAAGVPLIVDEVFTGMGRLGSWFGFQRAGLRPDLLCLAKGLTGGTVPMALTLCPETIFNDFLSTTKAAAFLHGHSFTANPIACAAALASLKIYAAEDLLAKARTLESQGQAWIADRAVGLGLEAPRVCGSVLAFELPGSRRQDYFTDAATGVAKRAADRGLLLRPLGNTLYLCPPLTISESEYDRALRIIGESLV